MRATSIVARAPVNAQLDPQVGTSLTESRVLKSGLRLLHSWAILGLGDGDLNVVGNAVVPVVFGRVVEEVVDSVVLHMALVLPDFLGKVGATGWAVDAYLPAAGDDLGVGEDEVVNAVEDLLWQGEQEVSARLSAQIPSKVLHLPSPLLSSHPTYCLGFSNWCTVSLALIGFVVVWVWQLCREYDGPKVSRVASREG